MKPTLSLLSRLWLSEPDADLLRRAIVSGFPNATVDELAPAYTDLFLLNVYPYAGVFLDPSGELNGASAARAEARYAAAGYEPAELSRVAAPDHVGLCVGFLAYLTQQRASDVEFWGDLLEWLPVCTLAIEREPGAHEFYRFLARATGDELLSDTAAEFRREPEAEPGLSPDEKGEIRLSQILRFLLTPCRSGLFLSRGRLGRLAREAGLRIPFGSRFDVARSLFEGAGVESAVDRVIASFARETDEWDAAYRQIAEHHPAWAPTAERWRARLERTRKALSSMRGIVQSPPEWEYQERERDVAGPR